MPGIKSFIFYPLFHNTRISYAGMSKFLTSHSSVPLKHCYVTFYAGMSKSKDIPFYTLPKATSLLLLFLSECRSFVKLFKIVFVLLSLSSKALSPNYQISLFKPLLWKVSYQLIQLTQLGPWFLRSA